MAATVHVAAALENLIKVSADADVVKLYQQPHYLANQLLVCAWCFSKEMAIGVKVDNLRNARPFYWRTPNCLERLFEYFMECSNN